MTEVKDTTSYGSVEALPDLLDALIVGGGPAGTAAAFRCRELGLSALVIDYDDLMKRIRDYSKDKLILPSFGGGDQQRFPAGADLVEGLRFAPIDKDEICLRWKALYRQHEVPASIGIELLGVEPRDEGVLEVLTFDHRTLENRSFFARHLVIAIGRGVPRRFDIPGNLDGIAYRLKDAQLYVGAPSCVVGGGTSAAEAVIAISNAKIAAGDKSAVCWSYRGDKLPRVSKALAEVFFEAYIGNGNIQYYPHSEPVAIVTAEDRREYLAIRVDRRCIDGRPNETTHLEFHKERCIACIGEDLPAQLLASMGISMIVGGPKAKKRITVNRYLESAQPNVYLIGDLLSQVYLEAEDFAGDPAGFKEVKHRGNVKSSLRDGVLVAQIIAQRIAGRSDVDTNVAEFEEEENRAIVVVPAAVGSDGPPAASVEPERTTSNADAVLVRILPGGIEAEEFPLTLRGVTTIGRTDCDISFPHDTHLDTPHASIVHTDDGYLLRDDGSQTGVFLRLPVASNYAVENGDLVRVGRQFLRFTVEGDRASFVQYDDQGREVGHHDIPAKTIVLGRQAPDVTLDEKDRTLSRRQLAVSFDDGKLRIKDLKSVNGSYLRVRSARSIQHGQQFRIGQQVLALCRSDQVLDLPTEPPAPPVAATAAQTRAGLEPRGTKTGPDGSVAETPAPAAEPGALQATFQPAGVTVPVQPGQTLCEAAEAAGVKITAECHSGICGSDPIRVLAGSENFEPFEDQESETLDDICELRAGECRLACMVRIKGPVEVEIVDV